MKAQRGGFLVGLVVGLLAGLAAALAVALYVTKVPVPFINKVPQRTADQDAAEVERNKSWDPNAALGSKSAPRPTAAGSAPERSPLAPAKPAPAVATTAPPGAAPVAVAPPAPASAARAASKPGSSPLIFFAQAGAFTRADDAEAQRAKLALLGLDA